MDGQTDPALRTARSAGALAIAGAVSFLAAGFLPLLRLDAAVIELAGLPPGGSLVTWLAAAAHVWGPAIVVGVAGVTLLASPWSGGLRAGVLLAMGLLWLALVGHLVFQPLPRAGIAAGMPVALLGVALTLSAGLALLGPAAPLRPTAWVTRTVVAAGVVGGALLAWWAVGDRAFPGRGGPGIWALRALASLPFFVLAATAVAARVRRHPRYTITMGAAAVACGITLLLADLIGLRPGPFLFAALAAFVAGTAALVVVTLGLILRRPTSASVAALLGMAALVAASLLPLSGGPGIADTRLVPTTSAAAALTGTSLPGMLVAIPAAGVLTLLLTRRTRLGAGLLGGAAAMGLALFPTFGLQHAPRAGVLYGLTGAILLMLASLTALGEPEAVRPIPEGDLEPSPG